MAISMAEITAVVTADATQFDSAMTSSGKAVEDLGTKSQAASSSWVASSLAMGAASAVLSGALLSSISSASDLNEAMSAVNTVFGTSAGVITSFATDAPTNLGITEQAAISASSSLGALFQSVGLGAPQMADFSTQTLQAATDLASFYNVDPKDALSALQSGLVGESEPLRQFGILLDQASVQQEAVRLGLIETGGTMTQQQAVIARQSLIMSQLGAAQGDFGRTSDSLANQQRILSAEFGDVAAQLGTALLPAAVAIAGALVNVVGAFAGLPAPVQSAVAVVATAAAGLLALGAAIAPVVIAWGSFTTAIAPVVTALAGMAGGATGGAAAIALLTNPITLVIAALALLYTAYQTNFLGFADGVNTAAATVATAFGNLVALANAVATAFGEGGLGAALGVLGTAFQTAWTNISTAISSIDWDAVSTAILTKLQEISDAIVTTFNNIDWSAVGASLLAGVQTAVGLVVGLDTFLLQKGIDLIAGLFQGITDKWPDVDTWLLGLGQDAADTVGDLTPRLVDHGTQLITGLFTAAQTYWTDTAQPWLVSLPQLAADAVGDLSQTIVAHGTELLTGLYTGALDVWNNVLGPWIQSVPTLVADAVGDLSQTLYQKGQDVITGFLKGLQDAWQGVIDWATNLSIPWPTFSGPNIPNPLDNLPGGGGNNNSPARAAGGPVSSGLSYWVGERGPELFTPSQNGAITPNGAAMGAAGGGNTYLSIGNVNLPGVSDAQGFLDAMRDLMQSSAVATGRGVS